MEIKDGLVLKLSWDDSSIVVRDCKKLLEDETNGYFMYWYKKVGRYGIKGKESKASNCIYTKEEIIKHIKKGTWIIK